MDGFDRKLGENQRKEIMNGIESLSDRALDEEIFKCVENFIDRMSKPENEHAAKELLTENCPCNIYEEPDFINHYLMNYGRLIL